MISEGVILLYGIDVHAHLLVMRKIPPAHLFHPMYMALFWSARSLILRKNSPYTALFWSARIMFSKNFPAFSASLFHPTRLFGTLE